MKLEFYLVLNSMEIEVFKHFVKLIRRSMKRNTNLNLKSEFALSIRSKCRPNKHIETARNLVTSHFMTITQDLSSIDKHSTDLNECICRLTRRCACLCRRIERLHHRHSFRRAVHRMVKMSPSMMTMSKKLLQPSSMLLYTHQCTTN